MAQDKASIWKKLGRAVKLNYVKLLRSPGGAKKVATGFAIGFGLEFLVISTAMLVYIIFYPLVRLARGSLPAAIIGHVLAKLTFLPIPLLGVGKWIGNLLIPVHLTFPDWFPGLLSGFLNLELKTITGMSVISILLGLASYPLVYYTYELNRKRRAAKQSHKLLQVANQKSRV